MKEYVPRIVPELIEGGCAKGFCSPPRDIFEEIEGYVGHTISREIEKEFTQQISKITEEVVSKIYEKVGDEFSFKTIHRLVNDSLEEDVLRMMFNGSGRGACRYFNENIGSLKNDR